MREFFYTRNYCIGLQSITYWNPNWRKTTGNQDGMFPIVFAFFQWVPCSLFHPRGHLNEFLSLFLPRRHLNEFLSLFPRGNLNDFLSLFLHHVDISMGSFPCSCTTWISQWVPFLVPATWTSQWVPCSLFQPRGHLNDFLSLFLHHVDISMTSFPCSCHVEISMTSFPCSCTTWTSQWVPFLVPAPRGHLNVFLSLFLHHVDISMRSFPCSCTTWTSHWVPFIVPAPRGHLNEFLSLFLPGGHLKVFSVANLPNREN